VKYRHTADPVYDERCEQLILGTFPSPASREAGFFYGHPQNRFWKVLAMVYGERVPETVADKRRFLLVHRLALWDVIAECEVSGSADASITSVIPNDIIPILETAPINSIYVNGRLAEKLYNRFILPVTGRSAVYLPSTSPANAAWSLDRLVQAWSVIRR
jgi:hypoxanthine-DNA glycosylase